MFNHKNSIAVDKTKIRKQNYLGLNCGEISMVVLKSV